MARKLRDEPRHQYTLEEYYALEKAGDRRYEYWDGEIVCRSGGTLAHGQISRNVLRAIDRKLERRDCQAFTADMAIKIPTQGLYRYPDASVVCGEVQSERVNGLDVLVNPGLIVEVLSPTTEDRAGTRNALPTRVSLRCANTGLCRRISRTSRTTDETGACGFAPTIPEWMMQ